MSPLPPPLCHCLDSSCYPASSPALETCSAGFSQRELSKIAIQMITHLGARNNRYLSSHLSESGIKTPRRPVPPPEALDKAPRPWFCAFPWTQPVMDPGGGGPAVRPDRGAVWPLMRQKLFITVTRKMQAEQRPGGQARRALQVRIEYRL